MRPLLDRMLAWVALLSLRGFFRSVEVTGREQVPRDRPILVVANHYNAMVDAVLVVHVLGRVPRFLAKSTLWRSPLARPLLALAGLVPVRRRQDELSTSVDNAAMFQAIHRALRHRAVVAMFPEGMVSRTPSLEPLRTGAARIALGARTSGAAGLTIVPMGFLYEDRVALRSRALARVGRPIDLDAEIGAIVGREGPIGDDDADAVRRLTDAIQQRLEEVVPSYRDEREAAVLGRAAEIAQRRGRVIPPPPVSLADREALAQQLARAPESDRTRLLDALARYHLDLSLLGIRDEHLIAGYRPAQLLALVARSLVRFVVLAPFALVGSVVNVLPYIGVRWAGRLVRNPVLKATARLLAGLFLFPLAWLVAVWIVPFDGWVPAVGVLLAAPALGLVAVRALERAVAVRRAWRGWIALAERSGSLAQVRDDRSRLCALVAEVSRSRHPDAPAGSTATARLLPQPPAPDV